MSRSFTRTLANLALAAGLVGSGFIALPAQAAPAANAKPVVEATLKPAPNHRPEIEGGRITVKVGETVSRHINVLDEDGDEVKLSFQGRPLSWVEIKDGRLVLSPPADQATGVHRVTVRASDGKSRSYAKFIVTILPADAK